MVQLLIFLICRFQISSCILLRPILHQIIHMQFVKQVTYTKLVLTQATITLTIWTSLKVQYYLGKVYLDMFFWIITLINHGFTYFVKLINNNITSKVTLLFTKHKPNLTSFLHPSPREKKNLGRVNTECSQCTISKDYDQ